jgi:hypothetical protein
MVVLVTAIGVSGCGWTGKLDAMSKLDVSRASKRFCTAKYNNDASKCEAERVSYETDLKDAGRRRGVLTSWRWL